MKKGVEKRLRRTAQMLPVKELDSVYIEELIEQEIAGLEQESESFQDYLAANQLTLLEAFDNVETMHRVFPKYAVSYFKFRTSYFNRFEHIKETLYRFRKV